MDKLEYIKIFVHSPTGFKVALVDGDYDGEYFSRFKYHLNKYGYAFRHDDEYHYNYGTGQRKRIKQGLVNLHSEVLKPKKGYDVDHINGNKLDNRSCNLQYLTHKENCAKKNKNTRII